MCSRLIGFDTNYKKFIHFLLISRVLMTEL
jgi:hypothetical protein